MLSDSTWLTIYVVTFSCLFAMLLPDAMGRFLRFVTRWEARLIALYRRWRLSRQNIEVIDWNPFVRSSQRRWDTHNKYSEFGLMMRYFLINIIAGLFILPLYYLGKFFDIL